MTEQQNTGNKRTGSGIPRWIWAVVIVAVAVTVYVLRPAANSGPETAGDAADAALPRLVDLGADKCIPCKMMAPILAELKIEYEDVFGVEFIDVWKNSTAGEKYGIKMIPTQVFFAADGTELFRHEGFYGKEDILAKWRELGIKL